jgi:proteasome lid subunit RPN8/RPN11
MRVIQISNQLIEQTLDELRRGGAKGHERVVLWLGTPGAIVQVTEIFVPQQTTASDYFHISREGMAHLMRHLREDDLMIAAQVHSHPEDAFHSKADDYWAIVRHVGALSFVLPHFALETKAHSFLADAVLFELNEHNHWVEVSRPDVITRFAITE